MRGRKSRLTQELIRAICQPLAAGVPLKHAAASQDIAESTIYEWISKGRNGKRGYVRLFRAVERAKGEAVCELHHLVLHGTLVQSRGAQFMLERRFKDDYGPGVTSLEFRGPLEIMQRRLDPVKVAIDRDGRVIDPADAVRAAERVIID